MDTKQTAKEVTKTYHGVMYCKVNKLEPMIERALSQAFEAGEKKGRREGRIEALAKVRMRITGPCYSSGLPCGCKDDAVDAVAAALEKEKP